MKTRWNRNGKRTNLGWKGQPQRKEIYITLGIDYSANGAMSRATMRLDTEPVLTRYRALLEGARKHIILSTRLLVERSPLQIEQFEAEVDLQWPVLTQEQIDRFRRRNQATPTPEPIERWVPTDRVDRTNTRLISTRRLMSLAQVNEEFTVEFGGSGTDEAASHVAPTAGFDRTGCRYYVGSRHLMCTANPFGPCAGCKDYSA